MSKLSPLILLFFVALSMGSHLKANAATGVQLNTVVGWTDDSFFGISHSSEKFEVGLGFNYTAIPGSSSKGTVGQLFYFGPKMEIEPKLSWALGPIFMKYSNLSAQRDDYFAGIYLGLNYALTETFHLSGKIVPYAYYKDSTYGDYSYMFKQSLISLAYFW